ncbi:MAG TPA: response regulator [Candidatus Margulisiibacteriota bacterium]|nr:response regulator [Candidatus Margulisiibacteriota bacterium]
MNAKILIVEDDPDIMRVLQHTLKMAGFQVVLAYGGEDAIRKVALQKPDLVLTDLSMPKVSGVEVIEAIKTDPDTQHIPVVAVTAHVWDGIAQAAGNVGCDGYVSKPFTAKQIVQEVYRHLKLPGA